MFCYFFCIPRRLRHSSSCYFCDSQHLFCHVLCSDVYLQDVNFLRHSASGGVDRIKTDTRLSLRHYRLDLLLSILIGSIIIAEN